MLAEQNQDKTTLHFASKAVNWADVCFTAPGVLLILANGQILANAAWGRLLNTSWVALALGLFILSGIVWIGVLLRLQNRLIQLSVQPAGSAEPLPDAFFHVLHSWYIGGIVATVLLLMSLILMVVTPNLW